MSTKTSIYKVWISVEEQTTTEAYGETYEDYQELDSPFASTAIFDTEDAAHDFAQQLNDVGQNLIPASAEDFVDLKEKIAALLFDHEYEDPDQRPHEETCNELAELILNKLEIKV